MIRRRPRRDKRINIARSRRLDGSARPGRRLRLMRETAAPSSEAAVSETGGVFYGVAVKAVIGQQPGSGRRMVIGAPAGRKRTTINTALPSLTTTAR
jgi:hypothetical protein